LSSILSTVKKKEKKKKRKLRTIATPNTLPVLSRILLGALHNNPSNHNGTHKTGIIIIVLGIRKQRHKEAK
jgi:hypothetical protein